MTMAIDDLVTGRRHLVYPAVDEVVIDSASQEGVIRQVMADGEEVQLLLDTADGVALLLPATLVTRDEQNRLRLPITFEQLMNQQEEGRGWDEDHIVLPVVEEVLDIGKRERITGQIRITKSVDEYEAPVAESLTREGVAVERVPINRIVETAAAERHEDGKLIVPVHKEVLVVEKRLMLVEEIHITTVQQIEEVQRTVTLRREDVAIERIPQAPTGKAEP
jgi:uncharacterized protein (TIGR02271 family)